MRGFPSRWLTTGIITLVPIAAIVFIGLRASGITDWPPANAFTISAVVLISGCFLYLVAQEFGRKTFRIAMAVTLLLALADFAAAGASATPVASAAEKIVDTVTTTVSNESERVTTDPETEVQTTSSSQTTETTVDSTTIEPINPPAPTGPPDDSLFGYVDRGAEVRVAQLLPDAFGGFKLGLVGWMLIAVCVAFAWRRLENINARRVATPVVVEKFLVPGGYKDADRLTAQFENGLAHAGILEPASVPGGEVTSELIEVFDGDKGAATWFTPVLRLLKLAQPKRGTVVIPTLETLEPPCVSVRVVTARQRRTLYARSFTEPTLDDCVERAAAYVGQLTHSYNTTTPKWARWQSNDAEGFDLFVDVHAGRKLPVELAEFDRLTALLQDEKRKKDEGKPGEGAIEIKPPAESVKGKTVINLAELQSEDHTDQRRLALRQALRNNPSNGIARVELGHEYELRGWDGDRWKALRLYLEAAYDHPRLLVARYRVATTLSLIVGDIQNNSIAVPRTTDLGSIVELSSYVLVERGRFETNPFELIEGLGLHGKDADQAAFAEACRTTQETIIKLAERALRQTDELLGWRILPNAVMHVDERNYWVKLWKDHARRKHLRAQIKIVCRILALRKPGGPADLTALCNDVEKAQKKSGGAGVLYNAACFHAVAARHAGDDDGKNEQQRQAIGRLLWARRAVGEGFPSARWLDMDPDLDDIRDEPGFEEIVSWVRSSAFGLPALRKIQELDAERQPKPPPAKPDPDEWLLKPRTIRDWEAIKRGEVYEAIGDAIEEGTVSIDLTVP